MTSRRAAAALACVVLGAGLGACGGDDGDDGKADYQRALNGFCRSMEDGTKAVQTGAAEVQSASASDPKSAVKSIGTVLETFASTMNGALTKLKAADVPSDYEKFHGDAVKGVGQLVTKVQDVAKAALAGDTDAVLKLGGNLTAVKLPNLPGDLAEKTPACGRISN
jgi:hypothetical protein